MELKFTLCCKSWNYYLQFTMNKLLRETKLLVIHQLVKFVLALI